MRTTMVRRMRHSHRDGHRQQAISRAARWTPVTLMHPTLVARPFHRESWVYEEKYDGWRLVAHKAGDHVRLVSRTGRDHTRRFAELAAAIASLPSVTVILDGEVAIFDAQLVSRFEWLSPSGGHPTRAGGFRAMLERR